MADKITLGFFKALLTAALLYPAVALADVQISEMDDIAGGTWSGTGNMVFTDMVCLYNTAGINVNMKATTTTGSFVFSNGTNTIPFSITANGLTLIYNINRKVGTADTSSPTCNGAPATTLQLTVTEANLQAAVASTGYQAVITLVITHAGI